ncbi:MAG: DUF4326 domain-containing protein [Dolichospermum sp.]
MCTVVNKYKSDFDVYIGRGSIWGNPFVMQNKSDEERTRVISQYKVYLKDKIKSGEITIQMLLELDGKKLGCFCKPKPCHGDVIVQAVDWAKNKAV